MDNDDDILNYAGNYGEFHLIHLSQQSFLNDVFTTSNYFQTMK